MRTKKAVINLLVSSLSHIVVVVSTFIVKRIFVTHLGYELLGITTLFTSLVAMLSLTDLGMGTAVVYALYRPLAEDNKLIVSSIIRYCRKIYRIISLIILILGMCLLPFLRYFVQDEYQTSYLAMLFVPYVLSTSVTYLFAHRKNLLLADQKGYILSGIQLCYRIVTNVLQILVIVLLRNYFVYLYMKILLDLLENIVSAVICAKKYPFIREKAELLPENISKELRSNVFSLSFHKIGAYLISGTDNIIISVFNGERILAFCSGYTVIILTVSGFLEQIFQAVSSGIGNMLATEDEAYIGRFFHKIFLAQYFLVSFCCVCLSVMLDPFISVWIGDAAVLPRLVPLILAVNFYIVTISQPLGSLRASAGVFRPDRYLHIFMAAFNIVISVILVKPLGPAGVYLGTLVCLLIKEVCVLPLIASRYIVKGFHKTYYLRLILYTLLTGGLTSLVLWAANAIAVENIYLDLFMRLLLCLAIPNALNILLFHRTKDFRELCGTLMTIVREWICRRKRKEPAMCLSDDDIRRWNKKQYVMAAVVLTVLFSFYLIYALIFHSAVFSICAWFSGGFVAVLLVTGLFIYRTDSMTGIFERMISYRYLIAAVIFSYFVLWGAHGLSLNAWDMYFQNSPQAPVPVTFFGSPNAITSDVWGIIVPQIISQSELGYPFYNQDLMSTGANAILWGLPAWDIAIIGRPSLWGFFFLDVGRGLAWMYWSRILGLFLSGYEILNYISGKNRVLSSLGAALIAFGSMTQWWGGHVMVENLLYTQCIMALLICYVEHLDSSRIKTLLCIPFCLTLTGFVITLAPSAQVSLGYMALLFTAGLIINERHRIGSFVSKRDIFTVILAVAIAVAIVIRFIYLSQEDIQLVMNTAYPGKRISVGGEYPTGKFFYYIFQWLLPFSAAQPYNNCESSMLLPFLPVVFVCFPLVLLRRKERNPVPILLYGYLLFCTAWLFIPFPEIFARVTLFSFVTGKRILWTVCALSVYLGIYCMNQIWKNGGLGKWRALAINSGILLMYIVVTLLNIDKLSIFNRFAVFGTAFAFIIKAGVVLVTLAAWWAFHYALLNGYKKSVSIMLTALVVFCGLTINPLSLGTRAIDSKQVVLDITEISARDPDALWLYNGDFPKSLIPTAAKVKSFTSANMYPDYSKWEPLDPTGANRDIYNRYAHVSVRLTENATSFSLTSEEAILIEICPEDLSKTNASYIISETPLDANLWKLQELRFNAADNLWIYKTVV